MPKLVSKESRDRFGNLLKPKKSKKISKKRNFLEEAKERQKELDDSSTEEEEEEEDDDDESTEDFMEEDEKSSRSPPVLDLDSVKRSLFKRKYLDTQNKIHSLCSSLSCSKDDKKIICQLIGEYINHFLISACIKGDDLLKWSKKFINLIKIY